MHHATVDPHVGQRSGREGRATSPNRKPKAMSLPSNHESNSGLERHEIPTHLEVEDRLVLGLTLRQALFILAGLSASYTVFTQLHSVPFLANAHLVVLRLFVAFLPSLVALVSAVVQPAGRPIEEWVFVLTRYAAVPHISVWGPRSSDDAHAPDPNVDTAAHSTGALAPHASSLPVASRPKGELE